jgi:hypothetical protein
MMAEALAIAGFVSSIVQFVDFSSKIVHRLNEFHSSLARLRYPFETSKSSCHYWSILLSGQRNKLKMAVLARILKKQYGVL